LVFIAQAVLLLEQGSVGMEITVTADITKQVSEASAGLPVDKV